MILIAKNAITSWMFKFCAKLRNVFWYQCEYLWYFWSSRYLNILETQTMKRKRKKKSETKIFTHDRFNLCEKKIHQWKKRKRTFQIISINRIKVLRSKYLICFFWNIISRPQWANLIGLNVYDVMFVCP